MSSKKRKTPSTASPSAAAPSSDDPPAPTPAVAVAPATPPPETIKKQWRCDICLVALFDSFSDALIHEKTCAEVKAKAKAKEENGTAKGKGGAKTRRGRAAAAAASGGNAIVAVAASSAAGSGVGVKGRGRGRPRKNSSMALNLKGRGAGASVRGGGVTAAAAGASARNDTGKVVVAATATGSSTDAKSGGSLEAASSPDRGTEILATSEKEAEVSSSAMSTPTALARLSGLGGAAAIRKQSEDEDDEEGITISALQKSIKRDNDKDDEEDVTIGALQKSMANGRKKAKTATQATISTRVKATPVAGSVVVTTALPRSIDIVDFSPNERNNASATTTTTAAVFVASTTARAAVPSTVKDSTSFTSSKQPQQQQQQQQYSPLTLTNEPNTSTQKFPNPKTKWQCCVCENATFDNYNSAVLHEKKCLAAKKKKDAEDRNAAAADARRVEADREGEEKGDDKKKKVEGMMVAEEKKVNEGACDGSKVNEKEKVNEAHEEISEVKDGNSAPPQNDVNNGTNSNTTTTNKRKTNWRCDICLVAVFEEYEDAVAHEKQCTEVSKTKKAKKAELVAVAESQSDSSTTATTGAEAGDQTEEKVEEGENDAVAHEKTCTAIISGGQKKKAEGKIVKPTPTAARSPAQNAKPEMEQKEEKDMEGQEQRISQNDSFEHSPTSAFRTLPCHPPVVHSPVAAATTATAAAVGSNNDNIPASDPASNAVDKSNVATAQAPLPQSSSPGGEKEKKQLEKEPPSKLQQQPVSMDKTQQTPMSKGAPRNAGISRRVIGVSGNPVVIRHHVMGVNAEEVDELKEVGGVSKSGQSANEQQQPTIEKLSTKEPSIRQSIGGAIPSRGILAFSTPAGAASASLMGHHLKDATSAKARNENGSTMAKFSDVNVAKPVMPMPVGKASNASAASISDSAPSAAMPLPAANATSVSNQRDGIGPLEKEIAQRLAARKELSRKMKDVLPALSGAFSFKSSRESAMKDLQILNELQEGILSDSDSPCTSSAGRSADDVNQIPLIVIGSGRVSEQEALSTSLPSKYITASNSDNVNSAGFDGGTASNHKADDENSQVQSERTSVESNGAIKVDNNGRANLNEVELQQVKAESKRQNEADLTSRGEALESDATNEPLEAGLKVQDTTETTSEQKTEAMGQSQINVNPSNQGERVVNEQLREDVLESIATTIGPQYQKRTAVLLLAIIPIILLAWFVLLHIREELFATVLLPGVASITLAVIIFIVLIYSFIALTMIVTHEGPHHHQAQGYLSEICIAVQDSFCKPVITMERKEKESSVPAPTLREFLLHPDGFHMAFAPAFFGFFAYFGALAALEEETNGRIVPTPPSQPSAAAELHEEDGTTECGLKSVSGASAGAMAAVMLAAGIQPRKAAEFASTFTWGMVSDPPGLGGYVKGNNFEQCMREFIRRAAKIRRGPVGEDEKMNDDGSARPYQLEEALVPLAVSGFDLIRMKGLNLTNGCMAKAARSSAGFPGLFQPVAWSKSNSNERDGDSDKKKSWLPDLLLIDGGITDGLGINGLGAFPSSCTTKKRVINLVVGDFGSQGPSSINSLPAGVDASSLISIAIVGTPVCGPWAMENGPRAVESARKAMVAALDVPMKRIVRRSSSPGDDDNHHYVLHVDASKWLD